MCYLKDLG